MSDKRSEYRRVYGLSEASLVMDYHEWLEFELSGAREENKDLRLMHQKDTQIIHEKNKQIREFEKVFLTDINKTYAKLCKFEEFIKSKK